MSRIAKKPIAIPSNVKIELLDDENLHISSDSRELNLPVPQNILIDNSVDNLIYASFKSKPSSKTRGILGTFVRCLSSSIKGVTTGHLIVLKIVGIGFKCEILDDLLFLNIGLSHMVAIQKPNYVNISIPEAGVLHLTSINLQKLSEFASYIKSIKKVEPYKGKGIFCSSDNIIRKEVKSGKK